MSRYLRLVIDTHKCPIENEQPVMISDCERETKSGLAFANYPSYWNTRSSGTSNTLAIRNATSSVGE